MSDESFALNTQLPSFGTVTIESFRTWNPSYRTTAVGCWFVTETLCSTVTRFPPKSRTSALTVYVPDFFASNSRRLSCKISLSETDRGELPGSMMVHVITNLEPVYPSDAFTSTTTRSDSTTCSMTLNSTSGLVWSRIMYCVKLFDKAK